MISRRSSFANFHNQVLDALRFRKNMVMLRKFDWLQIIGLIAIPTIGVAVTGMGYWITQKQGDIEAESQRYAVMSSYYDQMRELVINGKLLESPGENVLSLSKTITLSAFRQLDGKRRGEILKSLYDMNLVGKCEPNAKTRKIDKCQPNSVLPITNARLDDLKFDEEISLTGINLTNTWLLKADLNEIDLSSANLSFARLNDAKLNKTTLEGANLSAALLQNTQMRGAKLKSADLRNADLTNANLQEADLQCAHLQSTNLKNVDLRNANLKNTKYDSKTIFPKNFNKKDHEMHEIKGISKNSSTTQSPCS